ncbi:MAG: circadian clock protein KaiC [Phycisphaerae bacterium]
MTDRDHDDGLRKLPTNIPGFDALSLGGLPRRRSTLVSGTSGSGKTVFAVQFLVEGIRAGEGGGVFVTFEEPPEDIRRNAAAMGWDTADWEKQGLWAFVDATPPIDGSDLEAGSYDLGGFLARLEYAIQRTGATRVSVDSFSAVFSQFGDAPTIRRELLRVGAALREMGVTAVLTAERVEEYGPVARYGVEEFVADNVIILRNALESERRRRTIEILKFRGASHQKGQWPFTIIEGEGFVAMPLSGIRLEQASSVERIPTGIGRMDELTGGGFFRDSVILLSGATGTGKTLTATHFVNAGISTGERCLLLGFEESREQFFRNAAGWGMDLAGAEANELLRVSCTYPENDSLEDHLIKIRNHIDEFAPVRVAVDSLSALNRVASPRSFREFIIGLTSLIKEREIAGLFTSTTETLMGGESVTEAHISTITDSIILLRYVEIHGQMRRGLTVLKMRGSMHDKRIFEYAIDDKGIHLGEPFRNVAGILAGNPTHLPREEVDRLEEMFPPPMPE